jgi:hypothetical protein
MTGPREAMDLLEMPEICLLVRQTISLYVAYQDGQTTKLGRHCNRSNVYCCLVRSERSRARTCLFSSFITVQLRSVSVPVLGCRPHGAFHARFVSHSYLR